MAGTQLGFHASRSTGSECHRHSDKYTGLTLAGFQDRYLQPLGHPSTAAQEYRNVVLLARIGAPPLETPQISLYISLNSEYLEN
ncbi:MAG: hypothetical protein ACRESO_06320 [Gammaproteobacteria bacterium]